MDWKPGRRYPVIVEYAGNGNYANKYGDVSTGEVEGSKLGYGISGGNGFIWICLPYVNTLENKNQPTGRIDGDPGKRSEMHRGRDLLIARDTARVVFCECEL
jgi:hypothetical protein